MQILAFPTIFHSENTFINFMIYFVFNTKRIIFALRILKNKKMSSVELEVQKASLAREILCVNDVSVINNVWLVLKGHKQKKSQKREIGFLEGKAKVTFHDDWSMTPEELGMV